MRRQKRAQPDRTPSDTLQHGYDSGLPPVPERCRDAYHKDAGGVKVGEEQLLLVRDDGSPIPHNVWNTSWRHICRPLKITAKAHTRHSTKPSTSSPRNASHHCIAARRTGKNADHDPGHGRAPDSRHERALSTYPRALTSRARRTMGGGGSHRSSNKKPRRLLQSKHNGMADG